MRSPKHESDRALRTALERVQTQLADSEATIKAIRSGDVDAIVVDGPKGCQIFTLQSPEEPYRILAEGMSEGAATLTTEGTILFCSRQLAEMAGRPAERLVNSSFLSLLREQERPRFPELMSCALKNNARAESHLRRTDGSILPV